MRPLRNPVLLASAALLAGCSNVPPIVAINSAAISQVESDLKRQIGIYMAASLAPPRIPVAGQDPSGKAIVTETLISDLPPQPKDPEPAKGPYNCGRGDVVFAIKNVSAELQTTYDRKLGASASLTVPEVVPITASYSGDWTGSNLQTLDYQLWPVEKSGQTNLAGWTPTEPDIEGAPIAAVLLNLRTALIASATRYDYSVFPAVLREHQACFRIYNREQTDKPAEDKYLLGLSFKTHNTAGLKATAMIVGLGVSGDWTSSRGNKLVVTFGRPDDPRVVAAQKEVKKKCIPDSTTASCKSAKDHLFDIPAGMPSDGEIGIHRREDAGDDLNGADGTGSGDDQSKP